MHSTNAPGGHSLTAAQQHAQRNRNSIFVDDGEIIGRESWPGEQFILRIHSPKCAAAAKPGSFAHITCDESMPMRRPLSIMRAGPDWIDILFKVHGEGLQKLGEKQPGDRVSVLGPIGRSFGFSADRPNAVLMGGGVGIPPMVFIADVLRNDDRFSPLAILASEIPFPFELQASKLSTPWLADEITSAMPLLEDWRVPSRLASLAGYDGCYEGYVTDLADNYLGSLLPAELEKVEVFACGPTPMLKAVAEQAGRYGVPCQVSLEEYMACAVGGCAGCAVLIETPDGPAMKRVCVDGPVFDASSVVWDP